MQPVQQYVEEKQRALSKHQFLSLLEPHPDMQRALWFAPYVAFWVMSFQDVIRLNAARVEDANLASIVDAHRKDDSGHDAWYLADLQALGCRNIDLAWLYDEPCRPIREASFAITAEVFRASDDYVRLALLLALEGAAHTLFGGVNAILRQAGHAKSLQYFGDGHLQIETGHELFADEVQQQMRGFDLSDAVLSECKALVDRVFAAFAQVADGLVAVKPN